MSTEPEPLEPEGDGEPRPRVLLWGSGEPSVQGLVLALVRRGIEGWFADGALEAELGGRRPNLVVLVGAAASDGGAATIGRVRAVASVPVVVLTEPSPIERRLAPFRYGARGVLIRRLDPEEMAGEVQHLLGEHARRVSESGTALSAAERDALNGLRSGELRGTATPHEGVSRRDLFAAGLPMPASFGAARDASPPPPGQAALAPTRSPAVAPSVEAPPSVVEVEADARPSRPSGTQVGPVVVAMIVLAAAVAWILRGAAHLSAVTPIMVDEVGTSGGAP